MQAAEESIIEVWEYQKYGPPTCLTRPSAGIPEGLHHFQLSGYHGTHYVVTEFSTRLGLCHRGSFSDLGQVRDLFPSALPFKITGPGRYETTEGKEVHVFASLVIDGTTLWRGVYKNQGLIHVWKEDGRTPPGTPGKTITKRLGDLK